MQPGRTEKCTILQLQTAVKRYLQPGEAETEVHSPILEIVKESDKKEYASGEKGYYKLTVRQLREDVTDQNIVIEDKLETQGASIVKDSIFVKKNGIELKDAKIEAR